MNKGLDVKILYEYRDNSYVGHICRKDRLSILVSNAVRIVKCRDTYVVRSVHADLQNESKETTTTSWLVVGGRTSATS